MKRRIYYLDDIEKAGLDYARMIAFGESDKLSGDNTRAAITKYLFDGVDSHPWSLIERLEANKKL